MSEYRISPAGVLVARCPNPRPGYRSQPWRVVHLEHPDCRYWVGRTLEDDTVADWPNLVPESGWDTPVLEFHRVMGASVARPRSEWFTDRWGLITEELAELRTALESEDDAQVMRELADVVFLMVGTAVALGYRLGPVFAEVCAANLRKVGPDGKPILRPEDGKVMKPPGFLPPNVAGAMRAIPETVAPQAKDTVSR